MAYEEQSFLASALKYVNNLLSVSDKDIMEINDKFDCKNCFILFIVFFVLFVCLLFAIISLFLI